MRTDSVHAQEKQTESAENQARKNVLKDQNGIVRAMFNVSDKTASGSLEQRARTFLHENRATLGITESNSSFTTERTQTIPGGSHVRFTQHYNGLQVFRGDVVVSANDRGEICMVINNCKRNIELETTAPSINPSAGISIARQAIGTNGRSVGKEDGAELMVYQTESGVSHLSYRVTIASENPSGDWQVFVDAASGKVLNVEDMSATHVDGARVQGSGFVYVTDPLSAAHKMYDSPGFSDNNDADTDSLSAHRSLVTLDSLTYEDGVYKLKGPYCEVTDIESPADPTYFSAATPDGFRYTRSQQQFEAVNVYYHVTTAYRHLLDLGFSSHALEQIRLDPHGFQGQDNAHYMPSGNWISWGEGGVDNAEDANMIWHEYGHAIQYNFIPTWGGGESGALGEGFGDYWAASYSRSFAQWQPGDYHYNWVFHWDGHNPFWMGRILNDMRTYPFGNLEIHTAGQIWSAALMGIWGELGRDITDRLILKSFFYLGSGVTGPIAAQAIIQADRDLYNGAHIQTLAYWLGTLKHFITPEATTGESYDGVPTEFSLDQNYPNPFNPSTSIRYSLPEQTSITLAVYDVLGQRVTTLADGLQQTGTHTVSWNGTDFNGIQVSTGVYFYRLEARNTSTHAGFVQLKKMMLLK